MSKLKLHPLKGRATNLSIPAPNAIQYNANAEKANADVVSDTWSPFYRMAVTAWHKSFSLVLGQRSRFRWLRALIHSSYGRN